MRRAARWLAKKPALLSFKLIVLLPLHINENDYQLLSAPNLSVKNMRKFSRALVSLALKHEFSLVIRGITD